MQAVCDVSIGRLFPVESVVWIRLKFDTDTAANSYFFYIVTGESFIRISVVKNYWSKTPPATQPFRRDIFYTHFEEVDLFGSIGVLYSQSPDAERPCNKNS